MDGEELNEEHITSMVSADPEFMRKLLKDDSRSNIRYRGADYGNGLTIAENSYNENGIVASKESSFYNLDQSNS